MLPGGGPVFPLPPRVAKGIAAALVDKLIHLYENSPVDDQFEISLQVERLRARCG